MIDRNDKLKSPNHTKRDLGIAFACIGATVLISVFYGEQETPKSKIPKKDEVTQPATNYTHYDLLGQNYSCEQGYEAIIAEGESVTRPAPDNIGTFVLANIGPSNGAKKPRIRVTRLVNLAEPAETRLVSVRSDVSLEEFNDQSFAEVTTRPGPTPNSIYANVDVCAPKM